MLSRNLAELEPTSTVLVDWTGLPIPASTISSLDASLFSVEARIQGGSLALSFGDDLLWALAFIIFDGRVERLVLLPPTIDQAARSALCRQAGVDWMISDTESGVEGVRHFGVERDSVMRALVSGPGRESRISAMSDRATEWLLCTSGTTGRPKLVRYQLPKLVAACVKGSERLTTSRWGTLYSLNRFAGLQVLFQALLSGATLLISDSGCPVSERLRQLSQGQCNALSATPTMWRRLLMSEEIADLSLDYITLGGEIAGQQLLDALAEAFPGAAIRHIYASTEAGVGFVVKDGKEGFPCSYLEEGHLHGMGVRVDAEGVLWMKSGRGAESYVDHNDAFLSNEGYWRTGDRVRIEGDRVFFCGREDGVINVGGNKLHPEEVEAVLLQHPGVAMARVSSRRSSVIGELVSAEIQMASSTDDERTFIGQLRRFCQTHLDDYKIPAFFTIVDVIEHTDAGKLRRASS